MIKALSKLGTEGNFLILIKKKIHEKPTAKTFNSEKLKAFPLR